MTRLGLALRYTAWWVALAVAALLWRALGKAADLAEQIRDFLAKQSALGNFFDWTNPTPADWDIVYWLVFAAMLPTLALPCASAVFSNRRPRLAMHLATAAILLAPALYVGVGLSAPSWPL